ncbi:hypothetical protein [Candidatus Finniella inopinata]|uniref:Uncharacterized protein n=1 Tax=Candidatus Finniella inopinata TaxID=1696036 RepID=A0A4Q7DKB3_9PROT|nr:hypothetical protein [Candidatus Finniella inopinata]RZI46635.1 hypothetical protein EQU50_03355 [Candidatus Finniella inopinata]
MMVSNYWDRFAKVGESQNQDNTSNYWGQFQSAEVGELSEPPINNDGVPPQEQQQNHGQDSSFWEKTKRIAGVAAHGFSQGVGGLADIAAIAEQRNTPEGFPSKTEVGVEKQTSSVPSDPVIADFLGQKVNQLFGSNLNPQDAFEKFVHLAGEFSVPIPGLGIAKTGAKVASLPMKALKHEALAAGGAAGITAADEAGVESTLGKMAAGIGGTTAVTALGAVNPKALALTLAGFGKSQLKTKALDAAKRIGVDLPGVAATDAVAPAAAHNLISRIPYFGDKIRETLSKTGEQYQRSFEELLDKVSPPLTEDLSQVAKRIYAPLENLLPATDTIDPTPWLQEIKKLETKLQSVAKSEPTKKLLGVFREIKQNLEGKTQEALPEYLATASETVKKSLEKQLQEGAPAVKPITVQEAVRQKIEFNKMMKDKNLFDRADSDSLSYLHNLQATTKTMLEDYGKQNPAFLQALKKADLEYGAYAKRENLEGLLGEKLSSLITEEPQYNPLIKALQKKDNQKFLKNNLGPENYQKLGDYVDVAKAMESIKRNNQNPSGSGWVGALASIAGGLYAAPAYTASLLAATQAGTKLLTSKRFITLAHRYAKNPTQSTAQKLEAIIKETTGKSSNILSQELGEIQKRQETSTHNKEE